MKDPEYQMLLESFIEHAKRQDSSLVDGSVMIFIPSGGSSTDASVFSWTSDSTTKTQQDIWHDSFVAMLFALITSGVDPETIHDIVEYVASNSSGVTANYQTADDDEEIVN